MNAQQSWSRTARASSVPRSPVFAERAAAIGVSGIICTPLANGQHANGCLTLIAKAPGAFDEQSAGLAAALVAHADIPLTSAEWRRQLRPAVSTRVGFPSQRGEILLEGGSPMGETRRKFDRDFREGAVRLVRETGKPIAQVARDLGINAGTLGNWVEADRGRRDGGDGQLSEDERAELARLRRENAELAMRCDVLKRSLALWVSDAMGSR
jgi:transposase